MGSELSKKWRNESSNTSGTGDTGTEAQKEARSKKKPSNGESNGKKTRGQKTSNSSSNGDWKAAADSRMEGRSTDGYNEGDNSKAASGGYGEPSKGKYSQKMGGYKTFGTEG